MAESRRLLINKERLQSVDNFVNILTLDSDESFDNFQIEHLTRMRFKPLWRSSGKPSKVLHAHGKTCLDSLIELGNLIKSRREDLGMTLQDLASTTRITPSVLEAIERGKTQIVIT